MYAQEIQNQFEQGQFASDNAEQIADQSLVFLSQVLEQLEANIRLVRSKLPEGGLIGNEAVEVAKTLLGGVYHDVMENEFCSPEGDMLGMDDRFQDMVHDSYRDTLKGVFAI